MSDFALVLNFVLLVIILFMQRRALQRWLKQLWVTWQQRRPRHWKPQSPHDCPHCQSGVKLHKLRSKADLRPYAERKSHRGRKKRVSTRGYACPNLACDYCGVNDDSFHALVGYGAHNGIQHRSNSSSGFWRKVSMCRCSFASPVTRTRRSLVGWSRCV